MPRLLSPAARRGVFAGETAEVFVGLLVITGVGLEGPLRFANNTESVFSRVHGEATPQEYLPFPFGVILPDERDDQIPSVRLRIDNVDSRIMASVRPLTGAPLVTVYVVLASSPDVREVGPIEGRLASVNYDLQEINASLTGPQVLSEPFPARVFNPNEWRGLL